jgi:hypothetical protein
VKLPIYKASMHEFNRTVRSVFPCPFTLDATSVSTELITRSVVVQFKGDVAPQSNLRTDRPSSSLNSRVVSFVVVFMLYIYVYI